MRSISSLLLTATVTSLILSSGARLDSPATSQVRKGEIKQPAPPKRKTYVNAQEGEMIAESFRKANEAFQREDFKAGREILKTAYFINPEDDLMPTTGVVVGNSFFYIANSQYGSFNSKERSFPQKYLRKISVMSLKL